MFHLFTFDPTCFPPNCHHQGSLSAIGSFLVPYMFKFKYKEYENWGTGYIHTYIDGKNVVKLYYW